MIALQVHYSCQCKAEERNFSNNFSLTKYKIQFPHLLNVFLFYLILSRLHVSCYFCFLLLILVIYIHLYRSLFISVVLTRSVEHYGSIGTSLSTDAESIILHPNSELTPELTPPPTPLLLHSDSTPTPLRLLLNPSQTRLQLRSPPVPFQIRFY